MRNGRTATSKFGKRDDVSDIRHDLKKLRFDIGNMLHNLSDEGAGEAHRRMDRLRRKAEYAREEAGDFARRGRDRAASAGRQARQQTTDHPIIAMAAAFTVGVAVGKLIDIIKR